MEYSEGSSNSSSHYANLLSTVSQLRADLEQTVDKMNKLDEQNQALQSNYEKVKDELVETRKKYVDARENYMRIAAEKLEAERKNEAFTESVKYQLEEKTKEFEAHREKYTPQDYEYVKIQVQEELEVTHKQKVQYLENEIEKHKEQYFSSRRELERSKMEFETISQNQKREMASQRDDLEATVHELRRQIGELQLKEYQPEKDEKLRAERVRNHELEGLLKSVQNELHDLRKERDSASHNAEMARSRHEESFLELRNKLTLAESDRQALESRLSTSQNSLNAAEAQLRSRRQNSEDMERQLRQTKAALEERDAAFKALQQKCLDDIENYQAVFDAERDDLRSKIELLEGKLQEREEVVRRSQRDIVEMQLRTESIVAEQRKTYSAQILEARQKIDSLELTVLESAESKKIRESQHSQSIDRYQTEASGLRSDISRLQREKEILHSQLRSIEHKNTSLKQKIAENKRAAEETERLMKLRLKSIESEKNAAEKKISKIQHELNDAHENLENMKVAHEKTLESIQREDEQKYEELGKAYRQKLSEMKSKVKKAVNRERKRGDAYKDHALIAHKREKALSGAALAAAGGPSYQAEHTSTSPF